jgi:hypothetical protein
MKVLPRSLRSLVILAISLAGIQAAHADSYTATVYENTPDASNSADPANQASNLASANFTIGSLGIDFETNDSPSTTIANFLNNPTFSNEVNGFDPTNQTDNSEVVITGSLYLNAGDNSFVVGHDDGVVLSITGFGNVVNAPGPTGFSNSPFNVTATNAGYYNFNLQYAECCGGPADLVFTVNNAPPVGPSPVPEPGTFVLIGSGILSAAAAIRRRILS